MEYGVNLYVDKDEKRAIERVLEHQKGKTLDRLKKDVCQGLKQSSLERLFVADRLNGDRESVEKL